MVRTVLAVLGVAALLCACAGRTGPRSSMLRGRAACAGGVCAPEPEGVHAGVVLFNYWLGESDKVKAHLGGISNRSRLFGDLIQHYRSLFAEMELGQREGVELLKRGDREAAWARLNALWVALPVVTLQLNYVVLASHAEDGGMVTTQWMAMLLDMNRRTAPVLEAALNGFDRRRMEAAANEHRADLAVLQENLPRIQAALAKGGRWTRNALFVADGVTLAVAAYDVLGLLEGGLPGGPELPVRFPGLAGAGGTAAGVVALPVEVLESLRELVHLGALSATTLSMGMTLMVGKPEAVGQRAPTSSKSAAQGSRSWRVDKYDRVVKWGARNIYHDPDTGLWWSKDTAGHGGSIWKVFVEERGGLRWIADADELGNFIVGKHKGPVGEFIPRSELTGW